MFIDFFSVGVATIIGWLILALWHSPLLFGLVYTKLLERKIKFVWLLVISLPILFIISLFLTVVGFYLNVASFRDGAILGLMIWFAFVLPVHLFSWFLDKKRAKLFWLEEGIWFVEFILLGGVIGG